LGQWQAWRERIARRLAPPHRVAVVGVVRDAAGRVLLVQEPRRGWEPPGGYVEVGEDPQAAVCREIWEESGCHVTVERLLAVYALLDPPFVTILLFQCAYVSGTPGPSNETLAAAWFTPDDTIRRVSSPPVHVPMADALPPGPHVIYRAYRRGVGTVVSALDGPPALDQR
jgi:8-oxo-dGTP pyrophosphatase MutT (NUDIX family)